MKYLLLILIVPIIGISCSGDEDIEKCITSDFHKKRPSKEDVLHKQCEPWKDYSCCTNGRTISSHQSINHYKFNLNHCPTQPMSNKCRKHFTQDLCFYECEPFVKPWIVKTNRSFAEERIYKVPICASDCDQWWEDCKDDYTCTNNWARNFKWTNGSNVCPHESQCVPMRQIYTSAKEFCELVWDHSWKYSVDKHCMKIWFKASEGNPNKETAKYYANLAANVSHTTYFSSFILFFTSILHLIY